MNKVFLNLGTKQSPHLLLTVAMQQAFQVLQMPVIELGEWLKGQIEQNPVLEFSTGIEEKHSEDSSELEEQPADSSNDYDKEFESVFFPEEHDWEKAQEDKRNRQFQETLIHQRPSLFAHLMEQAQQNFSSKEELAIAESIIGNLDERGFLSAQPESKEAEKILRVIQTFDPPGIAASDLRESLLIQLRLLGKKNSLAYRIIEHYFDALVHNKIPQIEKKLNCSSDALMEAVKKDISPLNIHPGFIFRDEPIRPIVPDILIKKIDDQWWIEINQEPLPLFNVSETWQQAFLNDEMSIKEKHYVKRHIASGNWLHQIIQRRNTTLKEITKYLLKKQRAFFDGDTKQLKPMTLIEIAKAIGMHESTVARAAADKFIACPQGVFSLKKFFTAAVISERGEKISNDTLKQLVAQLVRNEDKASPLSDEQLSLKIKKMGMPCARRTVAKYRHSLNIQPAKHRRKYPAQNKTP